jgi:hypothetical protein
MTNVDDIKNILSKGCPVGELNFVIPWGIPIDKTVSYGNPSIQQWKRWGETNEGMKEIFYTKAKWDLVNIPCLSSISSAEIQFQYPYSIYPVMFFYSIKYHFKDGEKMEEELAQNFGDHIIDHVDFFDRSVETGFTRKLWRPLSDHPLTITFHPSEPLNIFLDNNSERASFTGYSIQS